MLTTGSYQYMNAITEEDPIQIEGLYGVARAAHTASPLSQYLVLNESAYWSDVTEAGVLPRSPSSIAGAGYSYPYWTTYLRGQYREPDAPSGRPALFGNVIAYEGGSYASNHLLRTVFAPATAPSIYERDKHENTWHKVRLYYPRVDHFLGGFDLHQAGHEAPRYIPPSIERPGLDADLARVVALASALSVDPMMPESDLDTAASSWIESAKAGAIDSLIDWCFDNSTQKYLVAEELLKAFKRVTHGAYAARYRARLMMLAQAPSVRLRYAAGVAIAESGTLEDRGLLFALARGEKDPRIQRLFTDLAQCVVDVT